MAKVTQEINLDITDVNGETHFLIVPLEEAQSLYDELGNIVGRKQLTYPPGVRGSRVIETNE